MAKTQIFCWIPGRPRTVGRAQAGGVRSIACRHGGFRVLRGQTDRRFLSGHPLVFTFQSRQRATRFRSDVQKSFPELRTRIRSLKLLD